MFAEGSLKFGIYLRFESACSSQFNMGSNKHDSQTRGTAECTEVQQDANIREAQISGYKREETHLGAGSGMHRGPFTACTWGHSTQLVPQ